MRKENDEIRGQQKLFRYYFMSLWREKQHKHALMERMDLRQEMCKSSTEALYDKVEAMGVCVEEFGSKTYYLQFCPSNAAAQVVHSSKNDFFSTPTPGFTPNGATATGATPSGMPAHLGTSSANQGDATQTLISWFHELQDEQQMNK